MSTSENFGPPPSQWEEVLKQTSFGFLFSRDEWLTPESEHGELDLLAPHVRQTSSLDEELIAELNRPFVRGPLRPKSSLL